MFRCVIWLGYDGPFNFFVLVAIFKLYGVFAVTVVSRLHHTIDSLAKSNNNNMQSYSSKHVHITVQLSIKPAYFCVPARDNANRSDSCMVLIRTAAAATGKSVRMMRRVRSWRREDNCPSQCAAGVNLAGQQHWDRGDASTVSTMANRAAVFLFLGDFVYINC